MKVGLRSRRGVWVRNEKSRKKSGKCRNTLGARNSQLPPAADKWKTGAPRKPVLLKHAQKTDREKVENEGGGEWRRRKWRRRNMEEKW